MPDLPLLPGPDLLLLQGADPTGMSSPLGKLVVAATLVCALVVVLRWFWHQRNR